MKAINELGEVVFNSSKGYGWLLDEILFGVDKGGYLFLLERDDEIKQIKKLEAFQRYFSYTDKPIQDKRIYGFIELHKYTFPIMLSKEFSELDKAIKETLKKGEQAIKIYFGD